MKTQTMNEGEPLTLKCETDVNVYKESYWMKDGVAMTTNLKQSVVDVTRVVEFEVNRLSLTDRGEYKCVAIEWRGGLMNNKTIELVVKGISILS